MRSDSLMPFLGAVSAREAVALAIDSGETGNPLELLLESASAIEVLNQAGVVVPTSMLEEQARRILLTAVDEKRHWRLRAKAAECIAELALAKLDEIGELGLVIHACVRTFGEIVESRSWDSGGPGTSGSAFVYQLGRTFWSVDGDNQLDGPYDDTDSALQSVWVEVDEEEQAEEDEEIAVIREAAAAITAGPEFWQGEELVTPRNDAMSEPPTDREHDGLKNEIERVFGSSDGRLLREAVTHPPLEIGPELERLIYAWVPIAPLTTSANAHGAFTWVFMRWALKGRAREVLHFLARSVDPRAPLAIEVIERVGNRDVPNNFAGVYVQGKWGWLHDELHPQPVHGTRRRFRGRWLRWECPLNLSTLVADGYLVEEDEEHGDVPIIPSLRFDFSVDDQAKEWCAVSTLYDEGTDDELAAWINGHPGCVCPV